MSLALVASFASSVAQVSPSRRTVIRSAMARTSSSRCETKRIPQPRAQRVDDSEEPLRFLPGQRSRRLVHHEDARPRRVVLEERGGYLDQHSVADGQFRDDRLRCEVLDTQHSQRRAGARVERLPVDEAEAARIDAAEKNVLRDAEAGDDVQLLMDESEAALMGLLRTAERSRRAVDPDVAIIRRNRAGQDLDQRTLARSVLAHQSERLSGAQFERSIFQSQHAAIGFAQIADRKQTHACCGAAVRRHLPSTASRSLT
jgi:hypothetical protein